MPNGKKLSLSLRSLLTDTLPYEVPVIFSNDRYHAGLVSLPAGRLGQILKRAVYGSSKYTVPYNYTIAKTESKRTTLSIVHPSSQVEIAKFYEMHAGGMINYCARGAFSLRRPASLASPFSIKITGDAEERTRSGIPQLLANAGEADPSHMTSYFVYEKYNLLGKFVTSREYLRLEARHPVMRSLDISKCFYNIYTHSITWSVKSKEFAKQQRDTYSFESRFDKLMQRCNYNETNGIVVGPEFSRIFAEIILQDIDDSLESDLFNQNLVAGREYDIRRYVDDYFIFARDFRTADLIEVELRKHLERYKLYVNEKKVVTTSTRPFVSNLTLARDEVAASLREVSSALAAIKTETDDGANIRRVKALRARLSDIRLVVARHRIEFSHLSGWLMSRLRRLARRGLKGLEDCSEPARAEAFASVAISSLETSLYICAVDVRVRTTYSLCQLALVFDQAKNILSHDQNDLVSHLISDQLYSILRSKLASNTNSGLADDIELYNILICGCHFVGDDFLQSKAVRDTFSKLLSVPSTTFFKYITLKFCMLKQAIRFKSDLEELNDRALRKIQASGVDIWRDTEEYLLALDYLASPDVPDLEKQRLFQYLFKDQVSFAAIREFGTYLGFTDWTGVTVEHQLRRKELRPVYAWS